MLIYELQPLRWIVQVRTGVPAQFWESMAAFNVDSVAKRYADDCAKSNPSNRYRVLELPEQREPRLKQIHTTKGE